MSMDLSNFETGETPVLPPMEEVTSVEQLFDRLDIQLDAYAGAAQHCRDATRMVLSDRNLAVQARMIWPDFDDNDRLNRGRERKLLRVVSDDSKTLLINAKFWAQQAVHPDTPEQARQSAWDFRAESELNAQDKDPITVKRDSDWSLVFDAEVERGQQEQAIRESISAFLDADEGNVIAFMEEVMNCDAREYDPLLSLLYKDATDKYIAGLVGNAYISLTENTEYFRQEFLDQIESEGDESTHIEAQSWLGWIAAHPMIEVAPSQLLDGQPQQDWPDVMRAWFDTYVSDKRDSLWAAYLDVLVPHSNPTIQSVDVEDLAAVIDKNQGEPQGVQKKRTNNGGRRAQKRGGRVTKKADPDKYLRNPEESSDYVFDSIATLIQTPNGWMPKDEMPIDDASVAEAISGLAPVKQFLKKYSGDKKIPDDLIAMFDSLLRVPHYDGATRMGSQAINLWLGSRAVDRPVWHLNPNKRSGMSIGNIGRKTRIFYVTHPDKEVRQLLLLDITHKQGAELLSNSAFRRTS